MREPCAPCNPAMDETKGQPVLELQLSFDALGFGPEFLPHVQNRCAPFEEAAGRGRKKSKLRTCSADPYGLIALRAQRQLGLRRSYSLQDFARLVLDGRAMPKGKELTCFAFCLIVISEVASRYFLSPDEIYSGGRAQLEFSGAQHVCQHIAVENGGFSTMKVGRVFRRHHASVRHAVDEVAAKRLSSPGLEAEIDNLENKILDLWAFAGDGAGIEARLALLV
ncbi:hypothetical protein [uncultured Cohaesibacter sp.]|uniref:hypothetical protein n=1 Tax=uncultured Cohaesibacter sp. TaxID=1002546 RepID=UPI0029C621A2|nr:hypothetical protein [uncultured Cohaesibacter sp.]